MPPKRISKRALAALTILQEELNSVSHDKRLTAALHNAVEILCRPSEAAPPREASELPIAPPVWWRDREPDDTPPDFIRKHYAQYIGKGLTLGFFQRKGQDKALYNALHKWLQEPQGGVLGAPKNSLPPDLYIPTKSELITQQLNEKGGAAAAMEQAREQARKHMRTPELREAARIYQAARRRPHLG